MTSHAARFDAEVIDYWLSRYPTAWGPRIPRLDRLGQEIRQRVPAYLTLHELTEISEWKAGVRNTGRLLDGEEVVHSKSCQAFSKRSDSDRVYRLVGDTPPVKGEGFAGVGVPIASAILRFVWPDRYGCVDWRNWYVLSHVRGPDGKPNALFSQELLPPLVRPRFSTGITIHGYLEYLQILRQLADADLHRSSAADSIPILKELRSNYTRRTPAEIDMAIFSYSQVFVPQKKRGRQPRKKSSPSPSAR